jgi:pyridoxamine 5'-phosphate oxidase
VPDHWGGYRLRVETIEFWQGRQNWLQDRLRYTRLDNGWKIERLMP